MYSKTGTTLSRPPYSGLTPIQADQAKSFLSSILLAANMAEISGVRMDMTKWIQAYRGHVGRVNHV